MKKYLSLIATVLVCINTKAQSGYTIKLNLKHAERYSVILYYKTGNEKFVDSAKADQSGNVVFKGITAEPVMALLSVKNPKLSFLRAPAYKRYEMPPPLEFILNNEKIEIDGDADSMVLASVKGGLNKEWGGLKTKFSRFTQDVFISTKKTADAYMKDKDIKLLLIPGNIAIKNIELKDSLLKLYINKNPSNFLSVYYLNEYADKYDEAALIKAYSNLTKHFKSTHFAKLIEERIKINDQVKIGKDAIDFVKTDTSGNSVSLNKLRGKYVLLDFWGSWCGPCAKSFPNLIVQYNKYRDQGLEIIGIAHEMPDDLSKAKENWKVGITHNKLPWIQVLNNDNLNQVDVIKEYAVTAFPTQILIDPKGKIIERFVGEQPDFNAKLEKIFIKK